MNLLIPDHLIEVQPYIEGTGFFFHVLTRDFAHLVNEKEKEAGKHEDK